MNNWQTVPLKDIGTFERGKGLQKSDFTDCGIPCIHYGQIFTYYGGFADSTISFVPQKTAKKCSIVHPGDAILAITSENVQDLCKSMVWLGNDDIVTGGHSGIFRHNQNPKFLGYYFQSEYFNHQKAKYAKGTKVIEINPEDILNRIKIKLPDLETQQKIVQILDQIENIIESFTERIEKEELAENAIAKKIFDQSTKNDFRDVQLGDVSEIYQPKTLSSKEIKRGDYPVFGANGIIGFHNQYNHEKRQVTISCRGANCGKINFTPEKCWITGNSMVVNADNKSNIDKLFLYYYLSNSNLSCLISGSGIPQITRAATQKYKIMLPSIEKQKEISLLLKTQSDFIYNLRKTRNQYRQIKKYLLNHLISGEFGLTNIELENGKEQQ